MLISQRELHLDLCQRLCACCDQEIWKYTGLMLLELTYRDLHLQRIILLPQESTMTQELHWKSQSGESSIATHSSTTFAKVVFTVVPRFLRV